MGKTALARNGFDDRNAAFSGKGCDFFFSKRIAHAATGDDQRLLGTLENFNSLLDRSCVGTRARNAPSARFEKHLRIIKGDFLRILRQRQKRRAAIGGVEHGRDCLRQATGGVVPDG